MTAAAPGADTGWTGNRLTVDTDSPEETERLGCLLGALLSAGDTVTLSGELGGGKTCFVRGIVAGAAPECRDLVSSPTFAILNEYPGAVPLYHYDCYRLRGADDAIALGLEDHLAADGICLIEWPDRIASLLPPDRLSVQFEYLGENSRRISLVAYGMRLQHLPAKLATPCDGTKKILSAPCCSAM